MNISLSPELEKFVFDKVNGGMYTSASEVIRESLRLMYTFDHLQQQRIAELNQALDVGMQQLAKSQRTEGKTSYQRIKKKIDQLK